MRCEIRDLLPSPARLIALACACVALALASGAAAETTHVVAPGHTLAKIARRYRVPVSALREANNLAPGQKLKSGQRIVIPQPGEVIEAGARRDRGAEARDEEFDSLRDDRTSRARGAEAWGRTPHKAGTVALVRGAQRWTGKTQLRGGKLAPAAAEAFKRMLRDDSSRSSRPIDPRLIGLITRVSDHFGGRPIEVVSGYRAHREGQHTAHSNHNVGKAIDFAVRGVPNETVRDFCHSFQDVGVGYYPNSSFVHLDVRTATAHWVDESKPGDPPRYSSVTGGGEAAKEAERGARGPSAKGRTGAESAADAEQ